MMSSAPWRCLGRNDGGPCDSGMDVVQVGSCVHSRRLVLLGRPRNRAVSRFDFWPDRFPLLHSFITQ